MTRRTISPPRLLGGLCVLGLAVGVIGPGCGGEPASRPSADSPSRSPNVLLIVWDTVRADHLSVYGYGHPTTPFVEEWARDAMVFDDAASSAASTIPNHASLFTGLLPTEHGTDAATPALDPDLTTLGELLEGAGYRTYFWAANPHLVRAQHFTQGFERDEHPWSPELIASARRIVRKKLSQRGEAGQGPLGPWILKDAGALAADRLERFLDEIGGQPWLAFLNYMEAHRPWLPAPDRVATMREGDPVTEAAPDLSWGAAWAYSFGLRDASPGELEHLRAIYDASLAELDALFADLVRRLEQRGVLEDTVVILTADHGELLGEHHLMDHQFSLHAPVNHVPLIVKGPGFGAGRSAAPVMALDVFATILEVAGLPAPDVQTRRSVSLRATLAERRRIAEYPAVDAEAFRLVRQIDPAFDPAPWNRRLRVLRSDGLKLIESEDGRHELYDVAVDPGETVDLAAERPELVRRMQDLLLEEARRLVPQGRGGRGVLSDEQRDMLRDLGYSGEAAGFEAVLRAELSSWTITDALADE